MLLRLTEGSLSGVEAERVGACERERLGCVQPRDRRTDRGEEKENVEAFRVCVGL